MTSRKAACISGKTLLVFPKQVDPSFVTSHIYAPQDTFSPQEFLGHKVRDGSFQKIKSDSL